ncbi:MAG: hypothetical protein ACP5GZ_11840 [Vulcanisaeta sp.]|jgi:hypothetical protein|uniref:hypothetical protein n=1 Tax=Vulcanisaeta sp. TaxID=2020871 RepID=UPI003D0BB10B
MGRRRKTLFRLVLIMLMLLVLAEITIITVNTQNLAGNEVTIAANVNSTSNYLLLILMAKNALIKISITITNPSNSSTIIVYLPNETAISLNPGDSVELTKLFPPSVYFGYACSGIITIPNINGTLTIDYTYISGKSNPVTIHYVKIPIYTHEIRDVIKNLTCVRGYYVIISTNSSKDVSLIIDAKYVVILV